MQDAEPLCSGETVRPGFTPEEFAWIKEMATKEEKTWPGAWVASIVRRVRAVATGRATTLRVGVEEWRVKR